MQMGSRREIFYLTPDVQVLCTVHDIFDEAVIRDEVLCAKVDITSVQDPLRIRVAEDGIGLLGILSPEKDHWDHGLLWAGKSELFFLWQCLALEV